jgi:3-deoxy-D-manno-octulosonic-acid transferase
MEKPVVLIIDQIGILSQLYQYADIAYIGGGFTKDGIHNVLEAAVFGKPVIWGPNDLKYPEAIGLRNAHGGIQIKDASTLNEKINQLLNDASFSKAIGDEALKFVHAHRGATQKTIEYIKQTQPRYKEPSYKLSHDGKYYIIYDKDTGKILKNKNYREVNLNFIYK